MIHDWSRDCELQSALRQPGDWCPHENGTIQARWSACKATLKRRYGVTCRHAIVRWWVCTFGEKGNMTRNACLCFFGFSPSPLFFCVVIIHEKGHWGFGKGTKKSYQDSATTIKHMNYSDRLKACKLPTLHYRRIRGDMIETYKIMTGKYDIEIAPR